MKRFSILMLVALLVVGQFSTAYASPLSDALDAEAACAAAKVACDLQQEAADEEKTDAETAADQYDNMSCELTLCETSVWNDFEMGAVSRMQQGDVAYGRAEDEYEDAVDIATLGIACMVAPVDYVQAKVYYDAAKGKFDHAANGTYDSFFYANGRFWAAANQYGIGITYALVCDSAEFCCECTWESPGCDDYEPEPDMEGEG